MSSVFGVNSVNHAPDRERLPKSLASLNWIALAEDQLFEDGEQLLVAVPVCNNGQRPSDGWYYEISVIVVHCDSEFFNVTLHGEEWGWSMLDVDFYARLN
jgi:hypothetical protein